MSPSSIRKFDMLYLGAIGVDLLSFALQRSALLGPQGGAWATILFGSLIALALWFAISRLQIGVLKWLLVVLLLFGIFSSRNLLADGFHWLDALRVLATAMQAAAIWFLFRPDARAWFAGQES